jgi:hypothetical protein
VQVAEGLPVTMGGVPFPVEDYAYDGEGNCTASHLSAIYASNDHNQLLEDDSYTYAYDAKGNRISRTAKAPRPASATVLLRRGRPPQAVIIAAASC